MLTATINSATMHYIPINQFEFEVKWQGVLV